MSSKASTAPSDTEGASGDFELYAVPALPPLRHDPRGQTKAYTQHVRQTQWATGGAMAPEPAAPKRVNSAGKRAALPAHLQLAGVSNEPPMPSPLLPETPRPLRIRPPIRLADGALFRNSTNSQVPTGYGTITYANHDTYTGDVVNGLPHGEGIYTSAPENLTRRGHWLKGRMCGKALQQLPGGWTFDGDCQNDVGHGPGVLTDSQGFVMRGEFAGGLPHGPTRVCFQSRDAFAGTFDAGKLGATTGIVRYPDGRLAVRLTRAGVAHLIPVSAETDAMYGQLLLEIEEAVVQERWLDLLACREHVLQGQRQEAAGVHVPAWSLASWRPYGPWFEALQALESHLASSRAESHVNQHALVRALLHLAGPARPYRSVGNVETVTHHLPHQAYPDQMAFVANTILPYYGTTRVVLGDATQMGRGEVTLPYAFAAQPGYAQHFAQDMHRLCEALTAAFGHDVQTHDARRPASMQILDSVFDAASMLDLSALRAPRPEDMAVADAVAPPPVVASVDRGKRPPGAPHAAAGMRPRRPAASKSAVAADGTLMPPPTLLPTTFEMSPTRPRFA